MVFAVSKEADIGQVDTLLWEQTTKVMCLHLKLCCVNGAPVRLFSLFNHGRLWRYSCCNREDLTPSRLLRSAMLSLTDFLAQWPVHTFAAFTLHRVLHWDGCQGRGSWLTEWCIGPLKLRTMGGGVNQWRDLWSVTGSPWGISADPQLFFKPLK